VKEIEIARLHLRYAHTRIHRPERVSSLASSIERFGQIIPVIALRQGVDSFVLIDGYLRVKAMMRCLRDTVVAEIQHPDPDRAQPRSEGGQQNASLRDL
jgi:ParB-like chromosome segregation protein Spo0J